MALAAESDSLKSLVELSDLTTGIDEALRTASPCRVRFGINIKFHSVARRAPSGARLICRAIGHHHTNFVIIGMNIFLQRNSPAKESGL